MIDPAKFNAPDAPLPRTTDMISISADELRELRAKARAFDTVAPQLDQLQALAAQGFLHVAGSTNLLTAAITEIVLLRQERLVPSMLPSDADILQVGFAAMWTSLAKHLNQPNKSAHQARYDAWVEGVQAVAPAIYSKMWAQTLHQLSHVVQGIQAETQERIDSATLSSPSPDRANNIREMVGRISCCKLILDTFSMIGQGGSDVKPDQKPDQNSAQKLN
jgi:hypothetical protein